AGRMAARASAHRQLTRRDCLSVANEVSPASFAAGHAFEQRRAVGAPATTAEVGAAGGCRLSRPARCRHETADARPISAPGRKRADKGVSLQYRTAVPK